MVLAQGKSETYLIGAKLIALNVSKNSFLKHYVFYGSRSSRTDTWKLIDLRSGIWLGD